MPKRVIVQAGHLAPRQPGHESETGASGEVQLVTEIRDKLIHLLQTDSRFVGISLPGRIPYGIKCDAALFLHADGSSNPKASGFSLGYPAGYPVNEKLAGLIEAEFLKIKGHPPHHSDNYTVDMREYYGFRHVTTDGPENLVEHGFVSNPDERKWLYAHTEDLAKAEYNALCQYFGFASGTATVMPFMFHTIHKDDSEHWFPGDKKDLTDVYNSFKTGDYKGYSVSRGSNPVNVVDHKVSVKKLDLTRWFKDDTQHYDQVSSSGHSRTYRKFKTLGFYKAYSVRRNWT